MEQDYKEINVRARIESLLSYCEKNACKVAPEDFEYTILMDEPDRNLDVDNILSEKGTDSDDCSYS